MFLNTDIVCPIVPSDISSDAHTTFEGPLTLIKMEHEAIPETPCIDGRQYYKKEQPVSQYRGSYEEQQVRFPVYN